MPTKGVHKSDWDEHFEDIVLFEIKQFEAYRQDPSPSFWTGIRDARPATRRRLLVRYLQACEIRGDPPPPDLIKLIADELKIPAKPLARVKDEEKVKAAARYHFRHPKASLRDIAKAVGLRGKDKGRPVYATNTIKLWMRQRIFQVAFHNEAAKAQTEQERRERLKLGVHQKKI